MTRRPAGGAAVLAAGPARRLAIIVAALGYVLASTLFGAGVATAAPAHVGLVVAGQVSTCVTYRAGMTGMDVLRAAGVAVDVRSDGLITRMNGSPADGKVLPDYWSYWHNTGSGWSYSQLGAGAARPAAGTVEGWIYDNGQTPPGAVSYQSLCGASDPAPAPPARTQPVVPPAARPTATKTLPAVPAPPATATTTSRRPSSDPPSAARPGSSAPSPGPSHSASAAARPSEARTSGAAVPSDAPETDAAAAAGAADRSSGGSAGTITGTVVAVIAVACLGGVAWWRRRRSSGA